MSDSTWWFRSAKAPSSKKYRKEKNPRYPCSASGCNHKTTKRQALGNGCVCHQCSSSLNVPKAVRALSTINAMA